MQTTAKKSTVGEYVAIDEQLVPFQGCCSCQQYMKSKPAKYDIKVFTLGQKYKTKEVYLCKQPQESPYEVSRMVNYGVLHLVRTIENSGCNNTDDSWFTNVPLVNQLLQKRLSCGYC